MAAAGPLNAAVAGTVRAAAPTVVPAAAVAARGHPRMTNNVGGGSGNGRGGSNVAEAVAVAPRASKWGDYECERDCAVQGDT